jgi:YHS domain-containing protein
MGGRSLIAKPTEPSGLMFQGSRQNRRSTHMRTALSRREAVGLVALAAAYPWATALRSAVPQGIPLAIKGYDPVAYFTEGKPTRGVPEFEYEWDGLRYRFSRAEHRELFKSDPVRYAPQFGNYCAMALSKSELVEADPENWLISDGKLYVFGKPVGPELFRKDLAGNVAKANGNRTLLPHH